MWPLWYIIKKPAGDPQWSSGVTGFSAKRKLWPGGKYLSFNSLCLPCLSSDQGFLSKVSAKKTTALQLPQQASGLEVGVMCGMNILRNGFKLRDI